MRLREAWLLYPQAPQGHGWPRAGEYSTALAAHGAELCRAGGLHVGNRWKTVIPHGSGDISTSATVRLVCVCYLPRVWRRLFVVNVFAKSAYLLDGTYITASLLHVHADAPVERMYAR